MEIHQKIHDLGLDGDIKRTDRFIADDELRLHGESSSNNDPLALAAAELMGEAAGKGGIEANQFEEAQKGIDSMINNIQSNKKARKEKMESLVQDLQLIKEKCSKQSYQEEGRKWMVNAQNAHSNKANFQYSNCVQTQMVAERKSKKSNY